MMQDSNREKRYSFDSFEITKANSTAFEKAKQFAENADSKPLAIFGGTATGKTHLLYAGKKKTQDELVLLFNAFYETGKRFMMTSSQKEAHNGMNARLLCRAFWGDSAEIATAYIKAEINTIG